MAKNQVWKILLVEDDEDDQILTREMLSESRGQKISLEWAATYAQAQRALVTGTYDAVLVDNFLDGAHQGIELIRESVKSGYPAPFILITGRGSYDLDIEAMQAGAMEYLSKSEATPANLERAIRYAIERRQAEKSQTQLDLARHPTGVNVRGDIYAEYVAGRNILIGFSAQQVAQLIKASRKEQIHRVWDGCPPYLGLAAFGTDEANLFFGREKLVEELLHQVDRKHFVCIAGPSGSGKSSLARAGLIHALKEGRLTGSQNWIFAMLYPQTDPLEQLRYALMRAVLDAGLSPGVVTQIRGMDGQHINPLQELIKMLAGDQPSRQLVIFIDQFEELFTQASERDRGRFIQILTEALGLPEAQLKVIIALRADFLSPCSSFPELSRWISQGFQLVGAMEPEDLARAVAMPAFEVGITIDPDLVRGVVLDTRGEPGSLPLMQFALKDLFDSQPHKKGKAVHLLWKDYLKRGGMYQALENHAESVMAKLVGKEALLEQLFSQLIQVRGAGVEATRRIETLSNLETLGFKVEDLQQVIQVLSDARLVVTGTSETEGQADVREHEQWHWSTITLAHERLIEAWPWLNHLVEEKRKDLALAGQVDLDAATWLGQPEEIRPDYLYRRAKLAGVLRWVKTRQIQISDQARIFLNACQAGDGADKQ